MSEFDRHKMPLLYEVPVSLRHDPIPLDIVHALSESARAQAVMRKRIEIAEYDGLTGLLRKEVFEQNAERLRERAHRNGETVLLAVLDIDNFKPVNDTAGHVAGDRLLAKSAQSLKEHTRPGDLLGRIGGDEFAFVFVSGDPLCDEQLKTIGADLKIQLDPDIRSFIVDELGIDPPAQEVSIGIAVWERGATMEQAKAQADLFMYMHKDRHQQGHNES